MGSGAVGNCAGAASVGGAVGAAPDSLDSIVRELAGTRPRLRSEVSLFPSQEIPRPYR